MKRKSTSKRLWSDEQDLELLLLIEEMGPNEWDKISLSLQDRTGK